ncbi:gamma-aminobutyric acid type B receptor subunit 2-like [Saccoglossus kowalevskii]|uniref:Gamma-aminobutyric acid type B receptor subunit 2-like n=1 Tax=Saccoglossus kowalevskii TaxID=10224 RepID=A0ABM0LVK0_SACKO|nr:PREDICTED: gamma-aminobutyric acid type B receptor subunit 2-like [Saccoglossus kowalevskii]
MMLHCSSLPMLLLALQFSWPLPIKTVSVALPENNTDSVVDLYIAAMFPFTSDGPESGVTRGVEPAINLALRHINNDSDVLSGCRLKMKFYDTKCDMAEGTKAFFEAVAEGPPKVALFGGICENVTAPIAETVAWWNLIQLSYANTEPFLSEREKYPTFFRTIPSLTDFNPAKLQLMEYFNWTHVATLHQDTPQFAFAQNKLSSSIDGSEKKIIEMKSFADDPTNAVSSIKESGARIILGSFDQKMALDVFCKAYREELYGRKYVWIIPGWYEENWWNVTNIPGGCSSGDILQALEGSLATNSLPLSTKAQETVSGLTPSEYKQQYDNIIGNNSTPFHGYAYDGVWVIALALDKLLRRTDNISSLSNYTYDNKEVFKQLFDAMNETDFFGVTGPVKFKNGDRLGTVVLEQFQAGRQVKIGEYYAHTDTINVTENSIIWQGGLPPLDLQIVHRIPADVSLVLFATMCCFSYIGIMVAMVFLFFNMRFRKHRYIKMSSPYINNLIIIGGLLCYASVFFSGSHSSYRSDKAFNLLCGLRAWSLALGFTLSFGAMFAKTWRVYSIFTDIRLKRKVIRDAKLFTIVGTLAFIDLIILISWGIVDPLVRQEQEGTAKPDQSGSDVTIIPITHHCKSTRMTMWLSLIYVSKGVLMVFGCFLAWETRQVSIPALNDSKYIGMSVYNVVVMCTVGVALSFFIPDSPSASFGLLSLFILFSTTVTLCLVFVPKILQLRKDPKGEDRKIRCTSQKGNFKTNSSIIKLQQMQTENIELNRILAEKDCEIAILLKELKMKMPLVFKKLVEGDAATVEVQPHGTSNSNQLDCDYGGVYLSVPLSNHIGLPTFSVGEFDSNVDKSALLQECDGDNCLSSPSTQHLCECPLLDQTRFLEEILPILGSLRETAILSDSDDSQLSLGEGKEWTSISSAVDNCYDNGWIMTSNSNFNMIICIR